jgi:hypothetical protein
MSARRVLASSDMADLNALPIPFTIVVLGMASHGRDTHKGVAQLVRWLIFMNVVFLVCDCGLRLKAPGAIPGRVGRCPKCGGQLRVPELPPPAPVRRESTDYAPGPGYGLQVPSEPSVLERSRTHPRGKSSPPETYLVRREPISLGGGLLPAVHAPETSLFGSLLYPLRAPESMGMIALLTLVWWIMLSAIPEYCLTLMGTADELGKGLLGQFIALLSILPVVFLFPFSLLYCLQYLSRVLVASAMGDAHQPRTPDRNFDGFFTGLSPWFIWLVLGVGVGLLPAIAYAQTSTSTGRAHMLLIVGLGASGIPYMVMALMMAFVHDHPFAATPWGVAIAMFRLGGSYILLCIFVGSAILLLLAIVIVLLLLRDNHFWIYLLLSVGGWAALNWIAITVMRALGNFYHHHKDVLRWNREHLRWGARWRL